MLCYLIAIVNLRYNLFACPIMHQLWLLICFLFVVKLCAGENSFIIRFVDMIRRLADMQNTQFITTTFRPELVKVADKIYGVTHKNRVSRVNVVSKEDALEFIEHDQSHSAEVRTFF